ncbi:MAG: peptide chain release factor N(5)-glutamine methyltransferase [Deltaproteobacteria bacterium]|nr:peptide chain release factor N(5)-glutamine methyltransferase [Deltaproteobacteria bacterium]
MPNTLFAILEKTTACLNENGIEAPGLNAEVLICHVLKCNKTNLYTNYELHLTDAQIDSITALVKRRVLREPLQYIIGRQGFWSLDFKVTKDVLIPRPETEILVEEAVKIRTLNPELRTILDLCTGSGCIAITLAKELPDAIIYATDNSAHALAVVKENAEMHGVLDRIKFIHGNLFDALDLRSGVKGGYPSKGWVGGQGVKRQEHGVWNVNLIVSNPPYIKTSDIETLEPEIKNFEPINALDGGADGLEIIRRIVNKAHLELKKDGWLMMEMGIGQALDVKTLIEKSGNYNEIAVIKDYSGIERVVKAKKWIR